MSELQLDYRLAKAIVHQLTRFHDLDDPRILRRFLVIVEAELKDCNGRCHDDFMDGVRLPPDHCCTDWLGLVTESLPQLLTHGISFITSEHASILAAFVRRGYEAGSSVSYFDPIVGIHSTPGELAARQKSVLKRNLFILRSMETEEEEDDDRRPERGDPSELVGTIVISLGAHAVTTRGTLKTIQQLLNRNDEAGTAIPLEELCHLIDRLVDSYYNCIRALVDIGESSITRLAPTSRALNACSLLVKSLVEAYLDPIPSMASCLQSFGYLGRLRSELQGLSLINPTRYSEAVACATKRFQGRYKYSNMDNYHCTKQNDLVEIRATNMPSIDATKARLNDFFEQSPGNDVKDVVRDLFARDLISLQHSGCGYGDVLVWLGFEVNPFDPILYQDINNHPTPDDEGHEWDFDEVKIL
jgi:hypothetical protein